MRKLYLLVASCVALVAFMGFSTSAIALVDPSCDGDPYNNDAVIHDFSMGTTDTSEAHAVSGILGSGLACGTEVRVAGSYEAGGSGSQYVLASIGVPLGAEINSTDGMTLTSYVGVARVNALTWLGTPVLPFFIDGDTVAEAVIRVAPDGDGDCPGGEVACYKGVLDGALVDAHNWNWVEGSEETGYTMSIGEMYNDSFPGTPAGLTHIKRFELCGTIGDVGDEGVPGECGDDSQPWLQKNGHAGTNIYTASATNRDGATTPTVEAEVVWTGPDRHISIGGLGGKVDPKSIAPCDGFPSC